MGVTEQGVYGDVARWGPEKKSHLPSPHQASEREREGIWTIQTGISSRTFRVQPISKRPSSGGRISERIGQLGGCQRGLERYPAPRVASPEVGGAFEEDTNAGSDNQRDFQRVNCDGRRGPFCRGRSACPDYVPLPGIIDGWPIEFPQRVRRV